MDDLLDFLFDDRESSETDGDAAAADEQSANSPMAEADEVSLTEEANNIFSKAELERRVSPRVDARMKN